MSDFSSVPDSFQQKTTAELQYLLENPGFYDANVVASARQELRQRGALLPVAQVFPEISAPAADYPQQEESTGRSRGWLLGGLLVVLGLGLAWWAFRPRPIVAAAAPAAPIILEATSARPLPSFEPETAVQVATTRRLLPAADRADTTAAGRYARMARRYWLAENTAAHLTAQALGDSATSAFAGQAGIGLERVGWFMSAMVYDQHLTPEMTGRLALMQRGMALRRSSLEALQAHAEAALPLLDANVERDQQEAASISREVLGQYRKAVPLRGRLDAL